MHIATLSYNELLNKAKQAEDANDYETAIENYQQAVKLNLNDSFAYNRLMIIYRKQKMYKEELQLIDEAIKNVKAELNKKKTKFNANSSISKLSKALMKSTGLVDKKGNETYEPEPIATWEKRKQTVLKRLHKKKK